MIKDQEKYKRETDVEIAIIKTEVKHQSKKIDEVLSLQAEILKALNGKGGIITQQGIAKENIRVIWLNVKGLWSFAGAATVAVISVVIAGASYVLKIIPK